MPSRYWEGMSSWVVLIALSALLYPGGFDLEDQDCLGGHQLAEMDSADEIKCVRLTGSRSNEHFDALSRFKNLERLEISRANLKEIPGFIGELDAMKHLNLARNKLSRLPGEVLEMKELRKLDLSNNPLESLPQEISKLNKLEELIIWSTQLKDLPAGFNELENLKFINWRKSQASPERADYWKDKLPHVQILYSSDCNCY